MQGDVLAERSPCVCVCLFVCLCVCDYWPLCTLQLCIHAWLTGALLYLLSIAGALPAESRLS